MKEKKQQSANPKRRMSTPSVLKAHPKLAMFLNALFAILLFSICLLVSYKYWIQAIGNGAYKYSDDTYAHIESAISSSALPDIGLDVLSLQNETTRFVASYENGRTKLVCDIQDGYFKAEVTAILSENYTITESFRNYNSLDEYMRDYWMTFGSRVFLSALFACCLIEASLFGCIGLISRLSKKVTSKHIVKTEEPTKAEPSVLGITTPSV